MINLLPVYFEHKTRFTIVIVVKFIQFKKRRGFKSGGQNQITEILRRSCLYTLMCVHMRLYMTRYVYVQIQVLVHIAFSSKQICKKKNYLSIS